MDDLTSLLLAARDGDDVSLAAWVRATQAEVWRMCAHLVGPDAAVVVVAAIALSACGGTAEPVDVDPAAARAATQLETDVLPGAGAAEPYRGRVLDDPLVEPSFTLTASDGEAPLVYPFGTTAETCVHDLRILTDEGWIL